MNLINKDILKHLENIDNHLKISPKIIFEYNLNWAKNNFNDQPAIYVFFDQDKLVYIGETSSLLKRMKDIRNTYNHTFRKHKGIKLFKTKPNSKGVFSETNEIALNDYFEKNIKVSFYYINFGRSEVESYLIHKNKGDKSNLLYNKIGKRDLSIIRMLQS